MLAQGDVSRKPFVTPCCIRGKRSSTTALASGVCIGAHADAKRDDALDAARTAFEKGDLDGASAALADFDSWSESGNSRAALHVAGGALIGGLSGGALGAFGGAAGAGLSSKLADQMKGISDSVSGTTGSTLIGNLAGNIASGLAGAAVGGTAGAAVASNVNLYNAGNDKNDTEAKKEAQELKQALDKERAMLGQAGAKVPSGAQAATVPSSALAAAGKGVKDASTPVRVSGSPMDVPRGTNAPATIGGVDYSAHAIDQMQGRGVPPSVVKNTIENGVNYPTRPGTTGYYDPVSNVRVVTNSKTGLVVTVIPGAP
ncbi:DUF4258 domain-containing protein [Paraburkholderia sacchari]|uniref:DUF4258 domain-containing protein n=1 Tax=Paraburkholderia sacchari TaxID=159450 RepID=UPI003D965968